VARVRIEGLVIDLLVIHMQLGTDALHHAPVELRLCHILRSTSYSNLNNDADKLTDRRPAADSAD
jgi:hypothetical protein